MQGLKRRKEYQCCGCLASMYEFPALIEDASAIKCPDCQRKDGHKMSDSEYVCLKQYYKPPKMTMHQFRASLDVREQHSKDVLKAYFEKHPKA